MTQMELKPCPFCGGKAEVHTHSHGEHCGQHIFYLNITCSKCGATPPSRGEVFTVGVRVDNKGELVILNDKRKALANAWNGRVKDAE